MSAAARPEVREAPAWSLPEPRTGRLASGAATVAYDIPGQHVLSLRVAVPMPLWAEPRRLEGIGTILSRTFDEGTARHSAEDLAELLERTGAALGASVGERGLVLEVDVPRRRLPDALALLAETLVEPAYAATEVRRQVRSRLAEIDQDRAQPGRRAAIEFVGTYYDESSRFSRPTGGTRGSVEQIAPEDVAAHHAAWIRPAGATVVLAGDLAGLDVDAVLEKGLGGWTGEPTALAPRPPGDERAGDAARIVVVDRPGSVQSELYVGTPGPDRRVEGGWAPYPVLGYLVGGAPQARLDAVLREEKGYTYGMRCAFRPRSRGGLFTTTGSVRSEVTVDAVDLTLRILESARDGFGEDETRRGIDFLVETAPGRYATADAVADEAAMRALDGQSTRDTDATLRQTRLLTPETLRESYRRWVDGSWTVVVVGEAEPVVEGLRALGRGRVDVVA